MGFGKKGFGKGKGKDSGGKGKNPGLTTSGLQNKKEPPPTYPTPELVFRREADPHSNETEQTLIAFNRQLNSFFRTSMYYYNAGCSHTADDRSLYIVERVGDAYFPPELIDANNKGSVRMVGTEGTSTSIVETLKAFEARKDEQGGNEEKNEDDDEEEKDQFDDESDFDMAAADDDQEYDADSGGDEYD